jgi:hypothetical protein
VTSTHRICRSVLKGTVLILYYLSQSMFVLKLLLSKTQEIELKMIEISFDREILYSDLTVTSLYSITDLRFLEGI